MSPLDNTLKLEITDTPQEDDLATVQNGLNGFNMAQGISPEKIILSVFMRDEAGQVQAGLYGATAWGWLHVRWLWVDETLRGQGIAGKLLNAAENEALSRGCHGAHIDTFSPDALRIYQHYGYRIFGELEDFPVGRTRTFLQKKLDLSGNG
jgi:GNAT superfamily N-acetyltransferase